MRKFFGRKKKGDHVPSQLSPVPMSSESHKHQPTSTSSTDGILSVKPAYLNLEEFKFPEGAMSMFCQARDDEILLDRCRRCSDGFVHTFMDWTTNIIAGMPKTDDYRAISYVWGKTIQLPMRCSHCGHSFHIPMQSAYRFRRLMMMTANSGDTVWLDAISIDQTDEEEKKQLIAAMGKIYSRAKMVSVLFPFPDGDGFKLVYDLTQAATLINTNKLEFAQSGQSATPNPRLEELKKVCIEFYEMLSRLEQNLDSYQYWRRAWTFQEWTLARNVSITWEGGMPQNLEQVKTTILHAATLTSVYAFQQGAYATIKFSVDRASVPMRFEVVRRIFPDEEAFIPPGMIDEKEAAFDMAMPSMRFGSALGLRAACGPNFSGVGAAQSINGMFDLRPSIPETDDERFQRRLLTTLHALGMSKREARYEADLVSSWASMCNIEYAYDVNDSYLVALQKVLYSLRMTHKVKVYNFLVNTAGAGGEVDAQFHDYACSHEQCNAGISKGKFQGIPILSGRADTAMHLRLALARPTTLPRLTGRGVELRKIKDASVFWVVPMKNHEEVIHHMKRLISGVADQFMFTDLAASVSRVLEAAPPAHLHRSSLAVVRIPLDSPDANEIGKAMGMLTWAIVPSDWDSTRCIVAREGLNGTLVLAASGEIRTELVAYLTISDHQSGTLLVPVDAHPMSCSCNADHSQGVINITLQSPIRGMAMNSTLLNDRLIRGLIHFEGRSSIAY